MTNSTGPVQLLRAAERPATAWRNGGGVTREVAGYPAGSGLDDFAWRVSLAEVGSAGPFSAFPGVDRVITLVEGPGMALTVDGTEHVVDAPFRPFAFAGDAATDCRLLGGPLVDFNVMTRRGRATAELALATEPRPLVVAAGATVLLVCLSGTADLDATTTLTRYDAALLTAPTTHTLDPTGTTAVLTLRAVEG
ncbi:HutD/Ves family protein [Kitasatospora purpeofusca]|uniref:HutD/Ves family protein n=1 Tax=Kitasatospora purpeofusca TaxID=67352 RepID=UPI002257712B|nr:HutD family protein [Kitasatospora purpeofusca]MCX4756485.1 HutD family protein [Kitasatospora purpeofusca]WSR35705.1 HutD family protein [Kitasatospora purpeofusca]WSR44012.1 HutD family protein [Kitasatospora purpeofusca]